MFEKLFGKGHKSSVNAEKKSVDVSADGLSDTDRRLRDQFYNDPEEDDSEICRAVLLIDG